MNYVHHIPGRLRVRSEVIRGNERAARVAQERIACVDGVKSVTTNPLTGSITVLYDPALLTADNLVGNLRKHGYTNRLQILLNMATRPPAFESRRLGAALARRVAACVLQVALERSAVALVAAML